MALSINKKPVESETAITNRLLRELIQKEDILANTLTKQKASQYQPKSNYFQANINPLSLSNLQLPGGKSESFFYCLGIDSTVPFVSLQGGGVSQKIFTWGEMIEVPPGQTVTVKNESFMRGDIQINSGHDFSAKPERISVPLRIKSVVGSPAEPDVSPGSQISEFPADTRRCRRAFVACNLTTVAALAQHSIVIFGKAIKHSFPGVDTTLVGGYYNYQTRLSYGASSLISEIPLGFAGDDGSNPNTPMALTDQADFILLGGVPPLLRVNLVSNLFMYILEY